MQSYAYSYTDKGIEARQTFYEQQARQRNFEKLVCGTCGESVCRYAKRRHERDKGCVVDTRDTSSTISTSVGSDE